MRHLLVAASTLSLLLAGNAAFAQSGQGGYTGQNPTTSPPTETPPGKGSGQGGYLGKDPGAGASSSYGGTGGATSGQGGYLGKNPGATPTEPDQSGATQPPPSRPAPAR